MSTTVDVSFVNQYQNNITILFQQKGSKLRPFVREKQSNGEYEFFERLSKTAAVLKVVRHGDTQYVDSLHTRRRAAKLDYEWADLIDRQDLHRMLIDPTSAYAVNASYAMGRAVDEAIITAFDADAQTGKDGTTAVSFPSGQHIVDGGTNLTLSKLIQAKEIFGNNDVDESDLYIVVSPAGITKLLNDTNVTSADYNTVRALVMGEIDTYVGFKFIQSTLLPKTGDIREHFAWSPMTMGLGMGLELSTTVDRLPTKSNATQVYVSGSFGAVRIVDEGVVKISADETA